MAYCITDPDGSYCYYFRCPNCGETVPETIPMGTSVSEYYTKKGFYCWKCGCTTKEKKISEPAEIKPPLKIVITHKSGDSYFSSGM